MKRREFITLVGSAAAWPLTARSQQANRTRQIGTLFAAPSDDALTKRTLATVVRELDLFGWKAGQTAVYHHQFVSNATELPDAASKLAAHQPDVIFAVTTPAARAAMNATREIPIVFAAVADPLGTGIVTNLARPGGNITGFSNAVAPLAGKWLELVRELDPTIKHVGLIFNPESASGRSAASLRELSAAAAQVNVEARAVEVRAAGDIDGAIANLAGARGALLVSQDVFNATNRTIIISAAARHRVPAVFPFRFYAAEGGLVSYGVDVFEGIRQAASYVDRILKGAKPGDLPVQQPTKFELLINLKAAKALGLDGTPLSARPRR